MRCTCNSHKPNEKLTTSWSNDLIKLECYKVSEWAECFFHVISLWCEYGTFFLCYYALWWFQITSHTTVRYHLLISLKYNEEKKRSTETVDMVNIKSANSIIIFAHFRRSWSSARSSMKSFDEFYRVLIMKAIIWRLL